MLAIAQKCRTQRPGSGRAFARTWSDIGLSEVLWVDRTSYLLYGSSIRRLWCAWLRVEKREERKSQQGKASQSLVAVDDRAVDFSHVWGRYIIISLPALQWLVNTGIPQHEV